VLANICHVKLRENELYLAMLALSPAKPTVSGIGLFQKLIIMLINKDYA
jgi:hypothetical protein